MRVKNLFVIIFMALISASAAAQTTVEFILAGHNQIPPVRTPGTGTIEITVKGDSLFVSGSFEDLQEYYLGAAVHYGRADEEGNQIYRLKAELNEDKTGGVFKVEENRFELREGQKDALRNGRMYINVRSNKNRRGEIRGQIPPLSF